MFCKNCGNKIDDTGKFCGRCGHSFSSFKSETTSVKEESPHSPEEMKQAHYHLLLIEQVKKTANIQMVKGVGWAILGLLITFITYEMASDGGSYFVFWGLVIYGAYIFLRGLYWRISPKSLLDKIHETKLDNNEGH